MAVFLDYIWQSTFCLLFFFGVYVLFLRNEKAFTFTRVYILVTPVLALVFPLISIPVSFDKPDISLEQSQFFRAFASQETPEEIVATFGLPEVTVQSTKLPFLWEIQDYLILAYFFIIALLAFRLFWNFVQLRMIWEKGWYETRYDLKHNYFLIPTFGLTPIFSFFNKLFWDNTQDLLPQEKEQIVKHEIEHIRQGHSYDVLYYQVLTILFWFNPAIHLMRAALVDIHEYLADERVIEKSFNKESYAKLIVKIAFKGIDLPIGNYFIRSKTLKRILMMKNPRKINWAKLLMVIPMSLVLMALISMKTETGQSLLQHSLTENFEEIKKKLIASQDSLEIGIKVKKIKTPTHYELISTLEDGKLKAQIGELEYEFSNIKSDEDYVKVRGLIQNLRNSSTISRDYGDLIKSNRELDSQAIPEIGMASWYNKIKEQVDLPENEDKLGLLGGNLVVEFIVNKDGQLEKPSIVRSLGGGIDQQVLELLQDPTFAKWTPAVKNGENVAMYQKIFIPFGETKNQSDAHRFFKNTPTPQADIQTTSDMVFDVVENAPEFHGGMEGWNTYLKENLNIPQAAKLNNVEGTVYVVFEVGKDGKLGKPEILRGIGYGADEEALRLISDSPDWIPGKQRGQAVNVRMRLPIRFKLDEEQKNGAVLNGKVVSESNDSGPAPSDDFKMFLSKNIKFPAESRKVGTSGTVVTALRLDKAGNVKSFDIVESPSEILREEVIRVLEKNNNSWTVAGNKDEYLVTLPITFIMNGVEPSGNRYQGMKHEVVVTGYDAKPKATPFTVKMISESDKQPLYILDGEVISSDKNIGDLVNPEQIESLEVLKGEKAIEKTPIFDITKYNAIIVITTKK